MTYELINADCREVLACMADDSVDSIVTDPPYHLTSIAKRFGPGQAPAQFGTDGAFARASRGFMGQTWDGGDIAFDPELWTECLRVLKPGGHLLAFSGTRTYHRMAYAIDLAGFEIRDMLEWLYGSGFPKSHDVSKALDKMAGGFTGGEYMATAPATPEAQEWAGWGTALKPAHEPVCMARKPLDGTVAANVLAHGVGALNINGCRIAAERPTGWSGAGSRLYDGGLSRDGGSARPVDGRFPANVLHDGSPDVLAGFPGTKPSAVYGGGQGLPSHTSLRPSDEGGSAARFFYCAKASKADRDVGCGELDRAPTAAMAGDLVGGQRLGGDGSPIATPVRTNTHPTVKPTDLMRWLVRLVTPPGGLVFDPFTGSGSTGRAAILEGCRFIGAELTPEYVPIARARIDAAVKGL